MTPPGERWAQDCHYTRSRDQKAAEIVGWDGERVDDALKVYAALLARGFCNALDMERVFGFLDALADEALKRGGYSHDIV